MPRRSPTKTPKQKAEDSLTQALISAFDDSDMELLTEREALEVALAVAEGWQMRLDELVGEDLEGG